MDNRGGVDDGSGVDYGSSVDQRSGVVGRRVVRWGVVRGSIVTDDALGGDGGAVVHWQETSAGGGQHGAEGEHLDKQKIQ